MFDDFYYEPTEFEQQIDEFKHQLMESVKKEILDEINMLRAENASLQEFKMKKEEMEREHRNVLSDLKRRADEAEKKAARARLRDLFGETLTVAWGVKDAYEELPKCDKCDKNRYIHFKSPSGKDLKEPCTCNDKIHHYIPQELSLVTFYMANEKTRERDGFIERHYVKRETISSDYDEYNNTTNVYRGEPFDTATRYGITFLEKSKCQEYCDWLSAKEKKEKARDDGC